jgi:hypothetical protein
MAFYPETGLPGKPLLQLAEVAIGEVGHYAAVGANEMVVVLPGSPHQIAPAVSAGVHLADKTEFGQYI